MEDFLDLCQEDPEMGRRLFLDAMEFYHSSVYQHKMPIPSYEAFCETDMYGETIQDICVALGEEVRTFHDILEPF